MTHDAPSFESPEEPPRDSGELFFTDRLDALRNEALPPRFLSIHSRTLEGRQELVRGAELLRFHGDRAKAGYSIQPQQVLLSDCLDTPHDFMALLMPRRSFKTSTLFAKALGRISTREDYMVAYSMATTGIKTRTRFRDDIVKPLEYLYPDPKERPFKIVKAGGSERIEWISTGSVFAFLPPKGDSFRSDAWDWIIVDEAGSADAEMTADLLAGAVATQDTRPGAQFTVTGTAPKFRTGNLLWDTLEKGRAATAGIAILEYSVEQDVTVEDITTDSKKDWAKFEPLILSAHPNIGRVTSLARMQVSFEAVPIEDVLTDYLGVAGEDGQTNFINMVNWRAHGIDGDLPDVPDNFALALSVNNAGNCASIMAVWRDSKKRVCIGVLDNRVGTEWVDARARALARKYRTPIVYDSGVGAVRGVIEKMEKARPKPRLTPYDWNAVSTAATILLSEIETGNFMHWNQPALDRAVEGAKKRGSVDTKRWGFGRISDEYDITPLEAASIGLRAYDEAKPRTRLVIDVEVAA